TMIHVRKIRTYFEIVAFSQYIDNAFDVRPRQSNCTECSPVVIGAGCRILRAAPKSGLLVNDAGPCCKTYMTFTLPPFGTVGFPPPNPASPMIGTSVPSTRTEIFVPSSIIWMGAA